MKNINILFFLLLMLAVPFAGLSQGCEEPSGDTDDGSPKVIGFIQPQYESHFTDPGTSTFKFMRARLGVTGQIPYDFTYYVMAEFSSFVSSGGNPFLLDAFISYRRFEWAKMSVGSFKQPFGLEVNTSCSGLHTIMRSKVSDQLISPQRDMGFMVFGGTNENLLQYQFAIMNGTGLGVKDNNSKKDMIGRLKVNPLDFLSIGGSFRYGYPINNEETRTSFAAEFEVNLNNLLVQGEYIYDEGDQNPAAGGGCGSDPVILGEKRGGYWVQGMYMTKWMLQPVMKFEMFDLDSDIDENEEYITTFGLNYFFNDWTRLQVNYQYKAEKAGEVENDALLMQLQVKF
ncbi:porin [Carboxylicivirga marina]|uniref:Porin n=1 Tax=Carboxylicivirga marina TaxID=2800988 RepID=A0ABS1HEN1_9BACT|nr:porin [Carboxylicivirga marina]MBK3516007.1 hypothetical protein [Carboxylicivirga marina]